ncbi:MAG: multiheme c-type cytochrome, partial [Hydrogenophilaceae bacterium]
MSRAIKIGAVTAVLALAGCGGGGGGSTSGTSSASSVATFIDSPVTGLQFESSSGSNLTDGNGNFTYREGDSVTFHIGNLYLGAAVPSDNKVTPLSLTGGSVDTGNAKLVRMLRTLQSLDSDGNLDNGIQIDASVRETLQAQAQLNLQTASDDEITGLIGNYKVDAQSAIDHFRAHQNDGSNAGSGYTPPSTTPSTASGSYALVAWNDLGMHCVDGKDYSVFSILPPYNNLHAHLINRGATSDKQVTSGVTLTYEAVVDATGSINTSSADKTNFWDYVLALFGADPAPDHGLNLSNPNISNPTPSLTPAAMAYNGTHGWWEAEGIPIMPYDDNGVKNYYPMVKVVAKNSSGAVLASTKVVLPVSDEMSCKSCHATNSSAAARPAAGWVNDGEPEKDWKKNILLLHDQKYPNAIADAGMASTYQGGTLLGTVTGGQPVLCAACHKSNALAAPGKSGIKSLTEALHIRHATVTDPNSGLTLDNLSNRDSCYLCHPGSKTKCLRGVMGEAKKSDGSNAIDCQSCHGNMSLVGKAGREGWFDEPNCQSCHDKTSPTGSFTRYTSVFSSGTTMRTIQDTR